MQAASFVEKVSSTGLGRVTANMQSTTVSGSGAAFGLLMHGETSAHMLGALAGTVTPLRRVAVQVPATPVVTLFQVPLPLSPAMCPAYVTVIPPPFEPAPLTLMTTSPAAETVPMPRPVCSGLVRYALYASSMITRQGSLVPSPVVTETPSHRPASGGATVPSGGRAASGCCAGSASFPSAVPGVPPVPPASAAVAFDEPEQAASHSNETKHPEIVRDRIGSPRLFAQIVHVCDVDRRGRMQDSFQHFPCPRTRAVVSGHVRDRHLAGACASFPPARGLQSAGSMRNRLRPSRTLAWLGYPRRCPSGLLVHSGPS